MVLNLVRNAAKFVEVGFLRMRATIEDKDVRLYIEDSGPGIPMSKRENLFAKYQESLDTLSQGTGLGLSLSKKLMNIMGGDIRLDNEYDSGVKGHPGACFVLDLKTPPATLSSTDEDISESERSEIIGSSPRSPKRFTSAGGVRGLAISDIEAPPISPDQHEPEQGSCLPKELKVLFVDDDCVLRKLLVRGLRKLRPDWSIAEAASGEAALAMCESETYDLIFLDQYSKSQ